MASGIISLLTGVEEKRDYLKELTCLKLSQGKTIVRRWHAYARQDRYDKKRELKNIVLERPHRHSDTARERDVEGLKNVDTIENSFKRLKS